MQSRKSRAAVRRRSIVSSGLAPIADMRDGVPDFRLLPKPGVDQNSWRTHTALRLATCNIGHILFVLRSRHETALAFDPGAILCRQGGLEIVDPLPWCKGRFAR